MGKGCCCLAWIDHRRGDLSTDNSSRHPSQQYPIIQTITNTHFVCSSYMDDGFMGVNYVYGCLCGFCAFCFSYIYIYCQLLGGISASTLITGRPNNTLSVFCMAVVGSGTKHCLNWTRTHNQFCIHICLGY